ncbi:hypothetical protein FO519_001221 [Halicephalobus sp. NKZ332]|nr:hypothetical protein FO519_001221 [Halicephalobus sp. NKZ332]
MCLGGNAANSTTVLKQFTENVQLCASLPENNEILKMYDLIFMSKDFSKAKGWTDGNSAILGLREKYEAEGKTIICPWGEKGVFAIDPSIDDSPFFVKGIPVKAIDTLGAGDCFIAASIWGMYSGKSVLESMKVLLIISFIVGVSSTFTPHFEAYLRNNFDDGFDKQMTRSDMGFGLMGSFGGKQSQNDIIKRKPIIFVHGVTLRAGIFMGHVQYFHHAGYSMAELYGTTYGDGGITPMFFKAMECNDVKQIRNFIEAVSSYTNSTVNIIAYSMGVAISRKAILGGRCVDTNEYLGEPLTNLVDTFIGVAGVAYGLENCPTFMKACNLIDVNSKKSMYEGFNVFGIYSKDDRLVGQNCCGHQCSELTFANGTSEHTILNHGTVLTMTKEIQLKMINDHSF